MNLDKFQREVGQWGEATFPRATPEGVTAHLLEEALELYGVANDDIPELLAIAAERRTDTVGNLEEAADCFILLLHLFHQRTAMLSAFARWKMQVNRERVWRPNEEPAGHVKHL